MTVTEIIQFSIEQPLDAHAPRTSIEKEVQKAAEALKGVDIPEQYALGIQVQDKGVIQITSEWDHIQDYGNLATTPGFSSFIDIMRSSVGEPQSIFHVALERSAFRLDGPVTANVVEFVQSYFPTSRVTPEFRKQVEEDFLKFDDIYIKGAKGGESWSSGWVVEEQEHEDIKGEKAKCFFVTRGWKNMDCFEQSIKSDAYKKAIPLLLGWNVPFEMVGV